jgi:DNA-binding GntR family transcriptional regulator
MDPAQGQAFSGRPTRRHKWMNRGLKELAADEIRDRIFAGELRPGHKVEQDAIASDLGISKLPVREALISLEAEGIVRNIPRRGAFVAALTPEDVRDHYQVYGLASSVAAERAATRMTDADLEYLRVAHAAMTEERDPERQAELNFDFHRQINVAGGSRRLLSVLEVLSRGIPTRFYETHPGWSTVAHADHTLILRALEEKDGAAAATAMASHLREGGEYAIRVLKESGFWDAPPSGSPTRSPS